MRLFLSIAFVSLTLSLTGCGDTLVTRYATIQDAKKDRLFERGWVPQVLPDTAGPLTEAHNIDTNARCALAAFQPSTFDEVLAALSSEGFQRYDGGVPSPPLWACPFGMSDLRGASIVLQRSGAIGDREFAAITKDGRLMFMGTR
jgi:hypothetical protein